MAIKTIDTETVDFSKITETKTINAEGKNAIRIDKITPEEVSGIKLSIAEDKLVLVNGTKSLIVENFKTVRYLKTSYATYKTNEGYTLTDIIAEGLVDNSKSPYSYLNVVNDSITGTKYSDLIDLSEFVTNAKTKGVYISAGRGNDTVKGSIYNDSIFAGDGNDSIIAGEGNDTIKGGKGDDTIIGGKGNDTITSKNGKSNIYFESGDGNDTVYLESGCRDKIYLNGINSEIPEAFLNNEINTFKLNNDLKLTYNNGNSSILIKDYYKEEVDLYHTKISNKNGHYLYLGSLANLNNLNIYEGTDSANRIRMGGYGPAADVDIPALVMSFGGNDLITNENIGNQGENIVLAGSGDDIMYFSGCKDNFYYGGDGNDIYVFDPLRDNVIQDNLGHNIIYIQGADYYIDGFMTNINKDGKITDDINLGCLIGEFNTVLNFNSNRYIRISEDSIKNTDIYYYYETSDANSPFYSYYNYLITLNIDKLKSEVSSWLLNNNFDDVYSAYNSGLTSEQASELGGIFGNNTTRTLVSNLRNDHFLANVVPPEYKNLYGF